MENIDTFFINNSDQRILLCFHQYFFTNYKNDISKINEAPSKLVVYLCYATIGIEEVVDNGWEHFRNSAWNTSDFYEAIDFFNTSFLAEINKRIKNKGLYENEASDPVSYYIIENKELLINEIAQAIRYHRKKLTDIVPKLIKLAKDNEKKFDTIKKEKWKSF